MSDTDTKPTVDEQARVDVRTSQLNRRQLFRTVAAAAAVVPGALLLEREAHAAPVPEKAQPQPVIDPVNKVPLSEDSLSNAQRTSKNLLKRLNKQIGDRDFVAAFVKDPEAALTTAGFEPKTEFERFDISKFNNIITGHVNNAVTVCASVGCIVCASAGGDV
jgi:hypothetical protein